MRTIRAMPGRAGALALLAVALLTAGCAAPLRAPAILTCDELDNEIRATEQARRQAVAKQDDAWTFVVPLRVAGVHVANKSAVSRADEWLAELRDESRARGCTRNA